MKYGLTFTIFLLFAQQLYAAEIGNYIRIFRGFKLPTLSQSDLLTKLPTFMNRTTELYGVVLNNYQVALPPTEHPEFIPDEIALLTYSSEEDYMRIRNTDEGRAYGAAHWEIFNRETSRSIVPESMERIPESLETRKAYDFSGKKIDWSQGHNTFFIGLRKNKFSAERFLERLRFHVTLAQAAFSGLGLRGYIVITDDNYEMAFMNWDSEKNMLRAFDTLNGARVAQDAQEIFDSLQWNGNSKFNGTSIEADHYYSTLGLAKF